MRDAPLTTAGKAGYGVAAVLLIVILVLGYMRFVLHEIPLVSGINA